MGDVTRPAPVGASDRRAGPDGPPAPAGPTPGADTRGRAVLWVLGALSTAVVVLQALRLAVHPQVDIDVYLQGASRLFAGTLYSGRTSGTGLLFTYPPFAALLFEPLRVLPTRVAQLAWAVTNTAALALLLAASLAAARPGLGRRTVVQWSLVLMAPAYLLDPVRLTFGYGQVNLLLAAAVLIDLTRRVTVGRRTLPRGVFTGIAAAVKLTPLVFVPFLFLVRSTRAAWTALATFVACSLLLVALAPRESWQFWTGDITDSRRIGRTFSFNNQSVAGVLERFHHGPVPSGVDLGVELLLAVAGLAVAVWAHRSSSALLGVLVCATTGLLISPITWTHHLVWTIPILAWLVLAADRPPGGPAWAAAAFALFWWAPNWRAWARGPAPLTEHGLQLLGGSGLFVAMLLFVAGVAALLAVRRRTGSGDRPGTVVTGAGR